MAPSGAQDGLHADGALGRDAGIERVVNVGHDGCTGCTAYCRAILSYSSVNGGAVGVDIDFFFFAAFFCHFLPFLP
jgi:hypothetical protein